ncbi:MAG: hypothetical protein AAF616_05425 [Bacteroidota bacterium]
MLQFSVYIVFNPDVRSFAEPKGGALALNFFFWLMLYLGWSRIKRDTADAEIVDNIQKMDKVKRSENSEIQDFICRSPILQHTAVAELKGEFFPIMVKRQDAELFVGVHCLRIVKQLGGAGGRLHDFLQRNLFLFFPVECPDVVIKKISLLSDLKKEKKYATYQVLLDAMIELSRKYEFNAIQIHKNRCLVLKDFKAKKNSMAIRPISTRHLNQIAEELRSTFHL